ncbi:hypothetical protein SAMN05421831_101256 [Allopseudospirillum japonicum]|uniref:Uncharacterized protein n=1 Tax=Allopseudospirillum japonicum TaxID=64971 RepID=A0A1H6Q769_9GAMM|nr:hypothetical protein [Allopseudospirillum japonicum]SEI39608.1 hypothetical protein SAMN05421831_101256 [Allopseudospirillum japonicum]
MASDDMSSKNQPPALLFEPLTAHAVDRTNADARSARKKKPPLPWSLYVGLLGLTIALGISSLHFYQELQGIQQQLAQVQASVQTQIQALSTQQTSSQQDWQTWQTQAQQDFQAWQTRLDAQAQAANTQHAQALQQALTKHQQQMQTWQAQAQQTLESMQNELAAQLAAQAAHQGDQAQDVSTQIQALQQTYQQLVAKTDTLTQQQRQMTQQIKQGVTETQLLQLQKNFNQQMQTVRTSLAGLDENLQTFDWEQVTLLRLQNQQTQQQIQEHQQRLASLEASRQQVIQSTQKLLSDVNDLYLQLDTLRKK